jgi:hypothetical protein
MATMTATQTIQAALVEAFKAAKAAGELAGVNEEDGGTCNLDSPAFKIKRVPAKLIKAAADEAGVSVSEFTWFGGRRWWWLGGFLDGQGNRRARISQAATAALKEALSSMENATVIEYCQMD